MFSCCMKPSSKEDASNQNDRSTKRLKSSMATNSMRESQSEDQIDSINSNNNNNTRLQNGISEQANKQAASKNSKNQSEENSNYKQSSFSSLMNSGFNSPVQGGNGMHHNNNNNQYNNFSRLTAMDKQIPSGLAACSLDANDIERFQRMIEKRQVTTQQSINTQVKSIFPMETMCFLRDSRNKYSTMAYCTSSSFFINTSMLTHSNGSNMGGNNGSNLSLSIVSNTSNLFKAPTANNTSQQQQQQQSSRLGATSTSSTEGTQIFTSSQIRASNIPANNNSSQSTSQQFEFLNYKYLYSKAIKFDNDHLENFTPQKIALHIAETFKKYPLLIDACCGIGGNTIQFQKHNKMVIAVDKSMRVLQTCVHNLQLYCADKGVNVEFVCADFLSLETGEYGCFGSNRADIVFLNPNVIPSSSDTKSDLFTQSSPDLLQSMKHAYIMSKNIAVLLPHHIDINQIPILLDKFYRSCPSYHTIEHFCPRIEIIYLNGNVKYFLIMLGDVSKITQEQELQFLQEQIRDRSYYPRGPYEERVMELLKTVLKITGMKRLVNFVIKGIDLNDLQTQKRNLLSTFADELQKDKILSDSDIKQMLTLNNNSGINNSGNNANNSGGGNGNGNNGNSDQNSAASPPVAYFELSMLSGQSNFEIDMQYGSQHSNDIIDPLGNLIQNSQEHHNHSAHSYESQQNSEYKVVESSYGDNIEQDEDSNYYAAQSQNSDFYMNEKQIIPNDGNPIFINPHTQIQTL